MLLTKKKLPSDNEIAPHLKAYNIVRDLQSEYVFNGRFMFTVFNMAIQEYESGMKIFTTTLELETTILKTTNIQTGNINIDPLSTAEKQIASEQKIKNWNKSNISVNKSEDTKPEGEDKTFKDQGGQENLEQKKEKK